MRLFCERKLIFHCLLLNRNGKYGVLNVVKHSKHSSSWTVIYDIIVEFFWYEINYVIIEYVKGLLRSNIKMNIKYILLCNDKKFWLWYRFAQSLFTFAPRTPMVLMWACKMLVKMSILRSMIGNRLYKATSIGIQS